jgi:hypothetical protein
MGYQPASGRSHISNADRILPRLNYIQKKSSFPLLQKFFNNVFIDAVKNTENIEIICCLSSLEILNLGNTDIIFWFMYGKPYLLVNNTIKQRI